MYKAKILDFDTKAEFVILNKEVEDPRDSQTNLAQIKFGDKKMIVHVVRSEIILKTEIGIPPLIADKLSEKNNLKVSDDEIRNEIQKQIKGMPGQEKMVLEYYQKNPSASQSLKGSLYEEKIIDLIKSKINLTSKEINSKEAEKIIAEFNKPNVDTDKSKTTSSAKNKSKSKKISKK